MAFVVAAPGETNEKKRDIYAVEPVGEVEDVLHDVIEEKLLHEPEILRGIDHEVIRDDILDDVFFRSLVRDMPVLDREYLEFIDRIHSGIPVVDREVEHVVDPVLGEVNLFFTLKTNTFKLSVRITLF